MRERWMRAVDALKALRRKRKKERRAARKAALGAAPAPRHGKQRRSKRDPFYQSVEWRAVRYKALKLAGARCNCCGRSAADGFVMNVDHIKPRRKHPELALSLANLQVLCATCNHGKGSWDSTDWREPDVRELMGELMPGALQ